MSPLEVQILLHYHYSPVDYPHKSEAFDMAMQKFIKAGLFTRYLNSHPEYVVDHEALQPYVDAVTAIPLPERVWTIPKQTFHDKLEALKKKKLVWTR